MREVKVWEASDGTRFDDREDCEAYENEALRARICKQLSISVSSMNEQRPVSWFIFKVQKAAEYGGIYLDSPNRTAYNHLRKWLDEDQANLVSAYQDFLQAQGANLGRTPNAVHGRLRAAYKEFESNGEHIGH